MRYDERGHIIVETIGSFLLFVFLIASILSLVNIVALQARIHFAMTQTAQALSMYSYIFEVTGMADRFITMDEETAEMRERVDSLKSSINGILDGIGSLSLEGMGENLDDAIDSGTELLSDPAKLAEMLIDDGINALFVLTVVKPLFGRYLSSEAMTGDQYLRSMRVTNGLDDIRFFSFNYFDLGSRSDDNSTIIDKDGNITLVVIYDVAYSFWSLPLPFTEPKLHITQTVKTRAWLGGEGERYKP